MRLIVDDERIVATASDAYEGPDAWLPEPADFDILRLAEYRLVNGALTLPAAVPRSVSRAQGKAALIQMGLWGAVLAYVAAIEDETARALAEVALHDTVVWERDSPFLNAAAAALGMDDAALDALFVAAGEVRL